MLAFLYMALRAGLEPVINGLTIYYSVNHVLMFNCIANYKLKI